MTVLVQKFGGTSVADAARIKRAAARAIAAQRAGQQVVVVVSARGKSTDELVSMAREITDNPPRREMDMLLSTGEQVSIALMAMAIADAGCKAISFTGGQVGLVTDNVHTKARIKRIDADKIFQQLKKGRIVIVAGFQGVDEQSNITTLGRGGSDTTAVALAAVLKAGQCEIYTDVDGVFTADPRLVPNARKIDRISYEEMLEMASMGASVMHPRAIEFGWKYKVPIHVRSSFTDQPGTWIIEEVADMEEIVVSGATLKKGLAKCVLLGVPDRPGIAAAIFAEIASHNIVVDDIMQTTMQPESASEDGSVSNVSFTFEADDLPQLRRITNDLAEKIGARRVEIEQGVAKVSVVGIGMKSHTGVAEKMFAALAREGVNIKNITTSEIKISCIIDEKEGPRALRTVHDAFNLSRGPARVEQ